jgi:hypothetical protein
MNQRSSDKIYVAGWVPIGLAAGIEVWLEKNRPKNRTDFLIAACVAKLQDCHIRVEMPADYSPSRRRRKLPASAFGLVKDESNSETGQTAKDDVPETAEEKGARERAEKMLMDAVKSSDQHHK